MKSEETGDRDDVRPRGDHPRGDERRRRMGVLLICSSSLFIVYLDSTILNIALPTLQKDLHASLSGLQWVADAYLLVVAALLMLAGAAADRFGRRRLFLVGLAGFGLGSLLCSLAPNTGSLIGLRMLQGIGGSMLTPVSLSIVRNTFHDPRERAQALGVWSAIFGLATACGPIVGGVLVATIGWRSIFWLNVPICAVMMAATVRYVPESRASRPRAIDVPGQLLAIALLGSLTYAVIQGPASGWSSAWVIAATCVAAVSAAGFVAVERRSAEPLLELRFFRSRPFTGASVIAVASFVVLGGFLFVITLYLQQARGFSPLRRLVAAARHAGDGGRRPRRRPAHRPPRPAHPAGRKRPADRRGHGDAARPRARHAVRLPGARPRGDRRGPRPRQPADHRRRHRGHAGGTGGGGVRRHLRDQADRLAARRRCHGQPGRHRGQRADGGRAGPPGRPQRGDARGVGAGRRLRPGRGADRLPVHHGPRPRVRRRGRGRRAARVTRRVRRAVAAPRRGRGLPFPGRRGPGPRRGCRGSSRSAACTAAPRRPRARSRRR